MSGTLAWSKLQKEWEKEGEMACRAGFSALGPQEQDVGTVSAGIRDQERG